MRDLITTSLVCLLLATTSAPGHAQQGLRERLEQRRATTTISDLPAGTTVLRDLGYGPTAAQRYDVYRPAQAKPGAPILPMVHGGGWRRGDKASPGVVGNKAAYWLNQGFVFVSVNNRLVPEAGPLEQARDVAAAVASVQHHAAQWGADPRQLILMGHSAGAHLVALLGSQPQWLSQAGAYRPLGVVSLDSGALDVPALMGQPRVPSFYFDAFGHDAAGWATASPQQQLAGDALPMLLVCSSTRHFPTSPCDEANKFAAHARVLGVPMQTLPEAMAHGEINSQLGLPTAYTRAVADWIAQRLMHVSH